MFWLHSGAHKGCKEVSGAGKSRVRYSALAGVVLAAVGIVALSVRPAAAQIGFNITGTVRDFTDEFGDPVPGVTAHPDFESPSVGGLQTGIVEALLGGDNKPVYAPSGPTITTAGATQFNQWYNNTPGVNLSQPITLNFTDQGGGFFGYSNSSFFPIDNQLFGNQGRSNNYGFTTEFHTTFQYQAGQIFTFTGDDDVFVFINRQLAIDLGGIHGAETQTVDLGTVAATLGITVGNTYQLDIFQAERHTTGSNFEILTNITLQGPAANAPEPGSFLLFGAGSMAFAPFMMRRFRRSV